MKKTKSKYLGFAWLKFFCFWRPWISFSFAMILVLNLIGYEEYRNIYFSSIWGIISLILLLIGQVLVIMLYFWAKNRDSRTLELIDWILKIEIIDYAYGGSIQYIKNIPYFLTIFIILCVFLYFLWYKLNMKYFEKREFWFNSNLDDVDSEYIEEIEEEQKINSNIKQNKTIVKKKTIYCKKCGGKLNQNKKCTKCGKQYFHFNFITSKTKILIIILTVLFIVSIVVNVYQGVLLKNNKTNSEFERNELKEEINRLEDDNYYLREELEYNEDKIDFMDEHIVIVVEGHGDIAYKYDCLDDYVDGDYTFWAYNEENAIQKGYKIISCD